MHDLGLASIALASPQKHVNIIYFEDKDGKRV